MEFPRDIIDFVTKIAPKQTQIHSALERGDESMGIGYLSEMVKSFSPTGFLGALKHFETIDDVRTYVEGMAKIEEFLGEYRDRGGDRTP